MRHGERALFEVQPIVYLDDPKLLDSLIDNNIEQYDSDRNLFISIDLKKHIRFEDVNGDGKTILRHARIGKGRKVQLNSLVRFRMRFMIDDRLIRTNYEKDPKVALTDQVKADPELLEPHDPSGDEDLAGMTVEARNEYTS